MSSVPLWAVAKSERPWVWQKQQSEPVLNGVHLCVDMQNIFARGGIWETP
jgi:hypothetical protein